MERTGPQVIATSVMLDPTDAAKLRLIATAQQRSFSAQVRFAIAEHIAGHDAAPSAIAA